MRDIRLELLRQGPAHNQLLSPLTQYLVLCGNRPADSLRVAFEHREFMAHLGALRYEDEGGNPAERRFHLDSMRSLVGGIINDVGDLESEVSSAGGDWLNLRLVISPAELSVLPFEMAKSPDSFPGAELPLLLNPHRPVVLTREIRQTGSRAYAWPTEPRVLVAAAAPGASVPLRAHLLALRRALDPWVPPGTDMSRWVRLLRRASLQEILAACDEEEFTHVHILAHGAPLSDGSPGSAVGYGLALHGPGSNGTDIVDGQRLAEALCRPSAKGGHRRPAVVVLASCDSGARPDVLYTGASMAQVLHGAGIPLVVASQFPLSKVGSVILTEELYKRLFLGEDPRRALYCLRRELKTRVPQSHDYVSLVAYAALPEDLAQQLVAVRLRRLLELLKVAKQWETEPGEGAKRRLDQATERLMAEMEILCDVSRLDRRDFTEVCGLLGSAHKRRADREFEQAKASREGKHKEQWRRSLATARDWYKRGSSEAIYAGSGMVSHWNAVQYLSLSAVLDGALLGLDKIWRRARASAEADAHDPTRPEDQTWAQGSLAELWMLRPLTAPTVKGHWQIAEGEALEHIEEMKRRAPIGSYFIKSTRDQLQRYVAWSELERWRDCEKLVVIAKKLLERLRESEATPELSAPRLVKTKPAKRKRAKRK